MDLLFSFLFVFTIGLIVYIVYEMFYGYKGEVFINTDILVLYFEKQIYLTWVRLGIANYIL